ncbi:MAG: Na/Pi cotransporter family protein [Geobacter sp.]|nr:Na/Pi cotransporter family protein [Geobacter sp.]
MSEPSSSLVLLLEALGGLGLFILGMKTMSDGLQRLAGDRFRRFLEISTGNRLTAPLFGGLLGFLLQSSSAAAILIVGLVNAGLISLYQALAVLLGTGLGTILSVHFLTLKIPFLSLPAIFIGVVLKFFSQRRKSAYLGDLLLGAGLLYFGLETMDAHFSPLREEAVFGHYDFLVSSRIYALFSGVLLTFMVQSGRTAVAIILALAANGLLSPEAGVAMISGEALGTACMAAIGAIGGSTSAKRTVVIYFLMSAGAAFLMILFVRPVVSIAETLQGAPPLAFTTIAYAHALFNCFVPLLYLPFLGMLTRVAPRIFPTMEVNGRIEARPMYLDPRVLNTPSVALTLAKNELGRMAETVVLMYNDLASLFHRYNARQASRIVQREELLDLLQKDISLFLVNLGRQPLPPAAAEELPMLFQSLNALEQMGDRIEQILDYLQRKKEERIRFSDAAMHELKLLAEAVENLLFLAADSIRDPSLSVSAATDTALLKKECDELTDRIQANHMQRLSSGQCTVAAGLIFLEILTAFGKVADQALVLITLTTKERS